MSHMVPTFSGDRGGGGMLAIPCGTHLHPITQSDQEVSV